MRIWFGYKSSRSKSNLSETKSSQFWSGRSDFFKSGGLIGYKSICSMRKRKRSDSVLWQNPLYSRNVKRAKWQHKQRNKKFNYTAVADRLRTVSWSNYGQPTGVVYRFYRANLPTHRNSCVIEGKNMKILLYSDIRFVSIDITFKTFKGFSSGKTVLLYSEKLAFLNVFENWNVRLHDSCGTDWGRSIKWQQTTSIRLVCLFGLQAQSSHSHNSCVIKRTNPICSKPIRPNCDQFVQILSQFVPLWSICPNLRQFVPKTGDKLTKFWSICPKIFYHYLQIWDELTKRCSIRPNLFIHHPDTTNPKPWH